MSYFCSDLDFSSDDPMKRLTDIPLNGSGNYLRWVRAAKVHLQALGRVNYINGKIERVREGEAGFDDWQSNDCLVMGWLLNSMEENIAKIFTFSDSSLDLWNLLKKMYGPRSTNERIFQLKQGIASAKQGSDTIDRYILPMMAKWNEMALYLPKTADLETLQTRAENEKVYQLLAGLNPDLDHVRDRILLSPELPSVETVLEMLRHAERVELVMIPESAATSNDGSSRGGARGGTAWCDHCQKAGHSKDRCWVLHPNRRPTKDRNGARRSTQIVAAVHGSQISVHEEEHSDMEYDW